MQQGERGETALADPPAGAVAAPAAPSPRRWTGLEIAMTVVIGALLIAAIAAGFASLYRGFWGPSAFAERYVQLIAEGRAADALAVDGVAVDTAELEAAGLPASAHDALLRSTALGYDLTDIHAVEERQVDGDTEVSVAYRIDGTTAESTFRISPSGWSGLVPAWSFARSPLAVVQVGVHGSMSFAVNGFEIDKRQVSPDGVDADPLAPVSLLAFAPGIYEVSVDTPTTAAEPQRALVDEPLTATAFDLQAAPTPEFLDVVAEQVSSFLTGQCASQQVLQPAGCPFWVSLENRLAAGTLPTWSVVQEPPIELVPDGAYWRIAEASGLAHIEMDVQSIATGRITHVSEDVPFTIDGTVEILADGTAQIRIGAPLLEG
jgi:hypothetical protein